MKKAPSKSTLTKKNKTFSNVPNDSKRSSRVAKANSCVKINSLNSEQNSRNQPLPTTIPLSHPARSYKQMPPYEVTHLSHQVDKPSTRLSQYNQAKSSTETIPIQQRDSEAMMRLKEKNEEVLKENASLRQKCCQLQEMSLRDKEKIKNLIIRINEVKHSNQANTDSKQPTTDYKQNTLEMKRTQPSNPHLPLSQHEISAGRLTSKPKIETPYKAITDQRNNGPCENRECLQRKKYLEGELYRERILRDKLEVERREWEHNKAELKAQYNELLIEIQEMRERDF